MAKKPNLPAVVHDHFRKANLLHTYVEKELGEARDHALEIGDELLAAKKAIPHGSWEDECGRLFDGSARTARFYMQFSRDMGTLPKRQRTPLLMLEGTLDGAAKAAKKLANPKPSPPKPKPIDVDSEPVDDEPDPPEPPKAKGKPPRKIERAAWFKQWEQAIGPLVRLVDKIADNVGESGGESHACIQGQLQAATEEMQEWMQVKK